MKLSQRGLLVLVLIVKLGTEAWAARAKEPLAKTAPEKRATVTFNRDVAPIIFQHCASCHRPSQAAPFPLLTYADVKKRATQISEAVEKRYMPPWLPERGQIEFVDDRSLTVEQIDLLREWVAQGAIEGTAADLPPLPKWTEGWRLGQADLVVKASQPYRLVAEGKDVYRNLVVPIPVSERKYVKGVEFLPGNWKVVHHAFITVDSTRLSRIRAAKENPPGFDGMLLPETATMPAGQFLGWQPGKVPSLAPKGLAWTLETNTDLVLQLHLHPSGKPEIVQPTIGFYFTDDPPTNSAFRINLHVLRMNIPPGTKDYSVEDRYTLPIDVSLMGIGPHAHYLGKKVQGYALSAGGTRKELILIKDWDFNWQGDYRYANPILLRKGTTVVMEWTFDNSSENVRNPNQPPQRVKYGSQTTNEMAELWLQAVPFNAAERGTLARDFYGHLANMSIDYNESRLAENPNNAEAHTRAGRGEMYFGQVQKALEHYQAAIKADPNYDRAYYELGFVYLKQNQFGEAQKAFENVVRLNHDDYEAEGSLGFIYLRNGNLEQAEFHFNAALRINPEDKVAQGYLERVLQAKANLKKKD